MHTIHEAIKAGKAIEVELDTYLLDDNRVLKYDRFFNGRMTAKWVDIEGGYAYRNFCEAYDQITQFAIEL